jgi:RimJ/RimL family protein N-acetyltransferase
MVRLDRLSDAQDGVRHKVSIAINSHSRGRRIGTAALALVRRLMPGVVLDADIMPDNTASQRLFGRAGFRQVGARLYRHLPR